MPESAAMSLLFARLAAVLIRAEVGHMVVAGLKFAGLIAVTTSALLFRRA